MEFYKSFVSRHLFIITAFLLSACIMTKNPQYKTASSYLDTRYDEIIHLDSQHQLSLADVDEAYLLSTMYLEKNKLKEARNLLKIVFDNQKTLPSGLAYIDVLNLLGETKEADNVHKFLTVLYKENEIQDQKRIHDRF